VSYFELPPEDDSTRPAVSWWGPPDDEVGVELPFDEEIARSEGARITLRSLAVFSTGIELGVLAEWLPGTLGEQPRVFVAPQSPQFLRLAFEHADGRRATNMDEDVWPEDEEEVPAIPLLVSHGLFYGPADTYGTLDTWIWGIPEAGDPVVVVEWPAAGIPVTRVPLDGEAIRTAAAAAGTHAPTCTPGESAAFFETAPPPDPRRERPSRRAWEEPPRGGVGGICGIRTALGVSSEAAMLLTDVVAYPDGLELALELRLRDPEAGFSDQFREIVRPTEADGALSPLFARLGVQLADGTKLTNLDPVRPFAGEQPSSPVLRQKSGSGGSEGIRVRFWLWPLPSHDPFTVVCEWPAFGIPERHTVIDVAAIVAAAGRATSLLEPVE
jgi:hypothetical protein